MVAKWAEDEGPKFTGGVVTSLRGAAKHAGLTHVGLAHMGKLETLSDADRLPRLDVLECSGCGKLQEHAIMGQAKTLRILRLNRCGEVPNLGFLDGLPSLEEFRFVGTNVVDGDLSPLLRLRSVGFDRKRHYSHTPKQLDALLAKNRSAP